jgi:hypothetical protein
MDRIDQAIVLLKDCKLKGLSFYDAHQALVQNGFSNAEIDDAADRFDYQVYGAPTANGKGHPYIYVYANGDSPSFLTSEDAATIKNIIRSFKLSI